ncbi:autotransporter outer membrane beta-barrel domain-containing protein, partial [Brucellaceae bacterium C25G]
MKLFLSVIPFAFLLNINVTNAADCSVSGDIVTCNPGEDYVPANHGGKKLNEYAEVYLYRTQANKHGYAQYSNQLIYNDVFIVVEGAQGDGYTLRNFGPTAEFNNLSIKATGLSGDGINVGRDNSGGQLTVHQTAQIESMLGIGIRAVSSERDLSEHSIIFNGSSSVITHANGGWDTGHGVYAGTQTSGCGFLIFYNFACRTLGSGEIKLLGQDSDHHLVVTHGNGAYGLYANGLGRIIANNINVETNGTNSHAIVAERQALDYYHSSSEQGQIDHSGTIELRGNVRVAVNGTNSYAFYVNSYSELSGKDSLDKIASIRSFDSSANKIVSDKVYDIQGNMFATNSGIIDLWMGNGSTFSGSTNISNNGILKLSISGENSVWHLNESATFTELTLNSKAALILAEEATLADHYTINGRLINDNGIINLSANSLVGDYLTLDGDYLSDNGVFELNAELGLDSSLTDKLIIIGNTSGTGIVRVNNIGGDGAQTVDGIKIIEVGGVSGATFSLDGDYEHEGEQAVVAGAYAYKLFQGSPSSADGDWYLRSQLKSTDPVDPVDPVDPEIPDPLYQGGVPLYEAYPQFLLGLNA